jgi:uncharacterized protein
MPRKFLRRLLPPSHRIREHRLLALFGPALHHPRLWHVSREGIALGAAIGGFFGLLVPIGQIPISAAAAIWLRANVPMSVVGTFITNPFTTVPIYYIAYRIGSALMGIEQAPLTLTSILEHVPATEGWLDMWTGRLLKLGKPLFVGLAALACAYALASYFSISLLWRALTLRAWRRRRGRTGAEGAQ